MADDRENAGDQTTESSTSGNIPIKQEFPSNCEAVVKSEISNMSSERTETSRPSPCKFTDTDPATGLVRNVRAVMSQKANKANILTGKPLKEMPGHTGYLTFATLYAQNSNVDAISGDGDNKISN